MDKSIVFFKPKNFNESKKLVSYIKDQNILHVNLVELSTEQQKRVLDFISGAAYIVDAQVVNPGKDIYLTIPKEVVFEFNYDTNTTTEEEKESSTVFDLRYDEEEEIITSNYQ